MPVVAGADLEAAAGPDADDPAEQIDEREYREYVTRRAFWATVVDGRAAADAAGDLGVSVNAVYLSEGRVLRRLRAELAGLLD